MALPACESAGRLARPSVSPAAAVERAPFLQVLTPGARTDVAAQLHAVAAPAGTVVVREGEAGDRYYLVAEGEVEVWASRPGGRTAPTSDDEVWLPDPRWQTLLARLGPGDGFGEMALLLGGRRRATVRAASDTWLYALDRPDLSRVVAQHRGLSAVLERVMAVRAIGASLGTASPFATLSPEHLQWLAARVTIQRVQDGEAVFQKGEPGNAMYVVRTGSVAVLDPDPPAGASSDPLAVLGPGDAFGEQALLTGEPRSATISAREPTELLRVERADFLHVLQEDHQRANYFARLVLQRQRPRRISQWTSEWQETGGTRVYVLKDTQRGRYLRLSEPCAFLWEQMDGHHTVRDLALAYFDRYQAFGVDVILDMMVQLHAAGFLQIAEVDPGAIGKVQTESTPKKRAVRSVLGHLPLTRYFTLPDADRHVALLHDRLLWPLYVQPTQALLLTTTLIGTALFVWLLLHSAPITGLSWTWGSALVSMLVAILVHAGVHEGAHAVTCKHAGREVHRAGVGWYYLLPVFFVDTSDSWMAGRSARIAIAAAGPYANFLLSALATLASQALGAPWQTALLQFAAVGYTVGVAQLNPLLEFDGYYVLMDWLDIPNLRPKALAYLGAHLAHARRSSPPPRLARIFAGYGVLTLAYTLFVSLSVLLGYRVYVAQLVGQIVPASLATALGWAIAAMLATLILRRAWDDLQLERAAG